MNMTVNVNGDIEYRNENGKRHNENSPAIICSNGTKYWYQNGKLHREDGPAIEYADGYNDYYLNDTYYYKSDYEKLISK